MQEDIKGIINLSKYSLNIKWRLTNCCNYRCSYCVRKHKLETVKNLTEDENKVSRSLSYIINIINKRKTSTKVEFIGGEVSLLNLKSLILKLGKHTKPYLKRVTFTTNFSKPLEYYNEIIEVGKSLGLTIGIIASFHFEFVSLEAFINKFNNLKRYEGNRLSTEMVSVSYNKRLVNEFIKKCEENNIEYKVDADFNDLDKSELITVSNKEDTEGFRIDFDNYSEYCNSLRKLEQSYGDSKKLPTKGFMCTLDYDYIYIDKDEHLGYNEVTKDCKTRMSLEDFKLRDFDDLIVCNKNCTLCGKMSVFKDKSLYNKEEIK